MRVGRSWDGIGLAIGIALAVGVGFAVAYRFASPAPPHTLRMAAGEAQGAYSLFAERYRAALARYGIELEIRHSSGSLENVALLRAGAVDIALLQGGVVDPGEAGGLQSLGSVFTEPVWVFLRAGLRAGRLSDLRGLRIDLGPESSGTHLLASRLLRANGVTEESADLRSLGGEAGARALRAGELDALFRVGSPDSPLVRSLLGSEGVTLLSVERAEAYTRRDRTLSRLVLPEGTVDLARDVPPRDTVLLATVAELAVGETFHPALADVVLEAAGSVHGGGDVFAEPGRFPGPGGVDLPLHPDARRFYRYGPPFLQRFLPFWAATQIDRLKVMLIPLVALLLPLARAFPPTYRWRVRSRIYRWYRELRAVDPGAAEALADGERASRLTDVDRIEREVARVPTPPSYAQELYDLRLHIAFVRGRLAEAGARGADGPEAPAGEARSG